MDRNEEWRDIEGFPLYQVSNLGHIRSLTRSFKRHGHTITWTGRMIEGWIKPGPSGKPVTRMVGLRRDGKTYEFRVHQLVLRAFIGPCPAGMEGCHNDGNPLNNDMGNLRWDTHAENLHDAVTHGTASRPPVHWGENHHFAKLTFAEVMTIRSMPTYHGVNAKLARQFGVSDTTISQIRRNQTRVAA